MAHYETNRQVIHLSNAKRCSDQAGHLLWPAPQRRGSKGGRLTWHWPTLDDAAVRVAGMIQYDCPAAIGTVAGVWKERSDGAATKKRAERIQKKAA
jgi:hypothetical protein